MSTLFDGADLFEAEKIVGSISPDHVMANCDVNLRNTHLAVLRLSRGSMDQLRQMVDAAKGDFRDVIYWDSLDVRDK